MDMIQPTSVDDRPWPRHVMLGFARGSVAGGAIFTWIVAQHHPMAALIGVAAVILGAAAQEVLS